jgi:hypothetical protein
VDSVLHFIGVITQRAKRKHIKGSNVMGTLCPSVPPSPASERLMDETRAADWLIHFYVTCHMISQLKFPSPLVTWSIAMKVGGPAIS